MKYTLTMTLGLALATSMTLSPCLAQADSDGPTFRPRTDANATRDLQALREALNQARDADGAVNSLGDFLQRNSEPSRSEQNVSPKSAPTDKSIDKEAEQKPRLELGGGRIQDRSEPTTPSSNRKTKELSSIGVLPGPHYFIVQQASPRYADRVVDNFLPAPQYPVSLASASIPVTGSSSVVRANFQEVPGTGAYQSAPVMPNTFPSGVFPNNLPVQTQTQPQFDGTTQPVLPFNNPSIPINPGTNPGVFPGGPTAPVNPPVTNPGMTNPVPGYSPPMVTNPGIANPVYPSTIAPPPSYYVPQAGATPRSSSDVLPNYPRPTTAVNGLPFVSGPPCQFDARYMVSQSAYRQSADACGAPARGCGTGYATQPGGSPFAYAPPTYMPYNNNGYDSGFRPLIGFGQTLNNAYLGRGVVGQPVAYVDGQPVRNFIRYLFP